MKKFKNLPTSTKITNFKKQISLNTYINLTSPLIYISLYTKPKNPKHLNI